MAKKLSMTPETSTKERLAHSLLVELENISVFLGEKDILRDISVSVHSGERIGLVGDNGSGKSTLLKTILGQVEPTSGWVRKDIKAKIGYLPQDMSMEETRTIREVVADGIPEIVQASKEYQKMIQSFQCSPSFLDKFAHIQNFLQRTNGYNIDKLLEKAVSMVGLNNALQDTVAVLSGGERMRLALARVLVTQPSLLLLDEPTNHLDIKARLWLENFLTSYDGAFIVVSHDRDLLDRVTKKTWYLNRGNFKTYSGNYSFYLDQAEIEGIQVRQEFEELLRQRREVTQAYREEQQRAAHVSREARSRRPRDRDRVRLGKYAETASETAGSRRQKLNEKKDGLDQEISEKRPTPPVNFHFDVLAPEFGHPQKIVANLKGASLGYGAEAVVSDVNIQITFGQKIGIFGVNGSGKSTLVKAIMGDPSVKTTGEIITTPSAGYLDQHCRNLDFSLSVIDNIREVTTGWDTATLRKHLARFLFFTDTQVNQTVSTLSGGEKIKLSLAIIGAQNPEILILDEPTNNLDLSSIEVITDVLASFPGAILAISHDLCFLRAIGVNQAYLIANHQFTPLIHSPTDGDVFEKELLEKL